MAKSFILTLLLISYLTAVSQSGKMKSSIGISIPVIWNNSEATYYQLGSPNHQTGNALSYGVNVSYSRYIYKKLFVIIGGGYFKQVFNIKRPFDYKAPDGTKPLVYTKYYSYDNIHWLAGIGYREELSKNISVNGTVSYSSYNSYRQRYAQEYFPGINEIYKKPLSIGSMINLDIGMEKNIANKISLGWSALLPIYTKWNNDGIFINNYYSSDEQQIARNKFSVGFSFSCYYHF